LKWKDYKKVIKMLSWVAWVQRPSGPINIEGSLRDFRVENVYGSE
jgi:hypothetical protein